MKERTDVTILPDISALYFDDNERIDCRYTSTQRTSKKRPSYHTTRMYQNDPCYTIDAYEVEGIKGLKNDFTKDRRNSKTSIESLEAPAKLQDDETRKAFKKATTERNRNSVKSSSGISIAILAIILVIIFGVLHFK